MKNSDKTTAILMVISFIIMVNACKKEDENHHRTIEIINNSEKAIYTHGGYSYPDTLFDIGRLSSPRSIHKVEPHESNRTAFRDRSFWESGFKAGWILSDTLMIYIYDAELLDSKTFTHIKNTVIQRYDLSLQDLQFLNWRISYPPSEAMKKIKMYPPYKKE